MVPIATIVVGNVEAFEQAAKQISRKPPKRKYKENHRLTGIEILNLRRMVKGVLGDNWEYFDLEAEIDWSLGYWDNRDILQDKLKAGVPNDMKYSKGYNDDLDAQCRAYYEEQTYNEPEPLAPAIQVVPSISRHPSRFRKVYVQAGGQWLPIWVKQAPAVVIEIPAASRMS